jgi:hypothetical protein
MAQSRRKLRTVDDRHLRLAYKGARCSICGRTVASIESRYGTSNGTFDFNHIDPSTKDPNYRNLIRRNLSAVQLDELDKCILLCRICHGIWHGQSLEGSADLRITLASGEEFKEKTRVFGVLDFKKPKFHLFSAGKFTFRFYQYILGGMPPVTIGASELESQLLYLSSLTKAHAYLNIFDDCGLVCKVERLDCRSMQVWFDIRFPLIQCEFSTDHPDFPQVWVRSGKAVIKNRGVRIKGEVRCILLYPSTDEPLSVACLDFKPE